MRAARIWSERMDTAIWPCATLDWSRASTNNHSVHRRARGASPAGAKRPRRAERVMCCKLHSPLNIVQIFIQVCLWFWKWRKPQLQSYEIELCDESKLRFLNTMLNTNKTLLHILNASLKWHMAMICGNCQKSKSSAFC